MENRIEELRKKQCGYTAAKKAIEETRPKIVAIRKESEETSGVTVFYDPAYDNFKIQLNASTKRHERSLEYITESDARLILASLNEFLKED
jgi:hypothetical protein